MKPSGTNFCYYYYYYYAPKHTEFIQLLLPSATFWVCLGQASSSWSLAHTASIGLLWQIANAHVLCHVTSEAVPLHDRASFLADTTCDSCVSRSRQLVVSIPPWTCHLRTAHYDFALLRWGFGIAHTFLKFDSDVIA